MWTQALHMVLTRFLKEGALELTYPDGRTRRYGEDGVAPVRVRMHDPAIPRKIIFAPDMTLGEGYMDGRITIENDDIEGLLTVAIRNRKQGNDPWVMRLATIIGTPLQRFLSLNLLSRSRSNVQHHYDLSGELYDLFLDEDRQYSCAYFPDWDMSLDAAQRAKKHHIAKKLCISPGDRVLDIGCGWGGMAITLARDYGARVVGVTLSDEQYTIARERVEKAGLSDRVEIRKQDYREVPETFDRIVSIGMFEHVGAAHFHEYFRQVHALLAPRGVALIHTIGSHAAPRATSPWIRRYIFPGGYIPSMSEVIRQVERVDLTTADIEVWRHHYARTLEHWHDRFRAHEDKARTLYDERFCRMWRYYLIAARLSFIEERLSVFQFQLVHDKTAVPLTRDYLYAGVDSIAAHRAEREKTTQQAL